MDVDGRTRDSEAVPAVVPRHDIGPEQAAQFGRVDGNRVAGARRRLVAPDDLGEPGDADRRASIERERGEERPSFACRDRLFATVRSDDKRAEDRYLDVCRSYGVEA